MSSMLFQFGLRSRVQRVGLVVAEAEAASAVVAEVRPGRARDRFS
jgi:hypothetical protein